RPARRRRGDLGRRLSGRPLPFRRISARAGRRAPQGARGAGPAVAGGPLRGATPRARNARGPRRQVRRRARGRRSARAEQKVRGGSAHAARRRGGLAMASVPADPARRFARGIVMPNLKPALRTTQQVLNYRERILGELADGAEFEPLMTLYLTADTPPEEIARAKLSGRVHGVK